VNTSCSATCGGCCSGNTCKPGSVASACGINGDACTVCGAGQTCTNSVCHVDPSSLWDLVVETGTCASFNGNGDSWDAFGGLPDPYVKLTLCYSSPNMTPPSYGYTFNVSNSTQPDWASSTVLSGVTAYDLLNCVNAMAMKDSDVIGGPNAAFDNDMGMCTFTITESLFSGVLLATQCTPVNPSEPTWSVNWRLVPHP